MWYSVNQQDLLPQLLKGVLMMRTFILSVLFAFTVNTTILAEPSELLTVEMAEEVMSAKFRQAAEVSLHKLRLGEADVIFHELPRFEEYIDTGNITLEELGTNKLEVYRLYQLLPPGMQSMSQELRWGDDRTRAEDSLNRLRSGNFLTPRMDFDDELFDFEVWLERGSLSHESLGTSKHEIAELRRDHYCMRAQQQLKRFLSTTPSKEEHCEIRKVLQEHGPCLTANES